MEELLFLRVGVEILLLRLLRVDAGSTLLVRVLYVLLLPWLLRTAAASELLPALTLRELV